MDIKYIYSSTSGNVCLYNMSNISEPAPSGVGGMKIINIAKKSNVDQDMNFINVMTSGDSNEWTKQEINDMQLGVKII